MIKKTCETEEKTLDALKTAFCSTAKTLQPLYKCVDRSRHNGIKGAKAKCAH